MAFKSFSTVMDGLPKDLSLFSDEDTYIAVFSTMQYGPQKESLRIIKEKFKVLYEGPLAFNHYHLERTSPTQYLVIFETKCQQEQSPAQDVLKTEEILEETI